MDLFLKLFESKRPSNEEKIREKIEESGGIEAVLRPKNEEILRELNKIENDQLRSEDGQQMRGAFHLKELQAELKENLDTAVTKNFQVFERKFMLQQAHLQEQLSMSTQQIIGAVREGPHDRIKNQVNLKS